MLLGTAGELLADNAHVALWPPALITLGWLRLPGGAGHALLAVQLAVPACWSATRSGDTPPLWRYLSHLPPTQRANTPLDCPPLPGAQALSTGNGAAGAGASSRTRASTHGRPEKRRTDSEAESRQRGSQP
jgi:hypothetical protein